MINSATDTVIKLDQSFTFFYLRNTILCALLTVPLYHQNEHTHTNTSQSKLDLTET